LQVSSACLALKYIFAQLLGIDICHWWSTGSSIRIIRRGCAFGC
jgi:hypothetical protein